MPRATFVAHGSGVSVSITFAIAPRTVADAALQAGVFDLASEVSSAAMDAEQEDQEGCPQQFGCRDMQCVDLPLAS